MIVEKLRNIVISINDWSCNPHVNVAFCLPTQPPAFKHFGTLNYKHHSSQSDMMGFIQWVELCVWIKVGRLQNQHVLTLVIMCFPWSTWNPLDTFMLYVMQLQLEVNLLTLKVNVMIFLISIFRKDLFIDTWCSY